VRPRTTSHGEAAATRATAESGAAPDRPAARAVVGWLLGRLRPQAAPIAIAVLAMLGHSALQLVPPVLTQRLIDDHLIGDATAGIGTLVLLFLAAILAAPLLELAHLGIMQRSGQRVIAALRVDIFAHLQRLDLRYYDRNQIGSVMTRLTSDVDALNELFTSAFVAVWTDACTVVGIMAVLLWLDWRLALATFLVLPLMALFAHWFRGHIRRSSRELRASLSATSGFLHERIAGMSTVQLFCREPRDFADFDRLGTVTREAALTSNFYNAMFSPAAELAGAFCIAVILIVAGGWVGEGGVSIGVLVAFLQYAHRFFRPITELSDTFGACQVALASAERIVTLLATPERIATPASPPAARTGAASSGGLVAFDNVSCSYAVGDVVLRNVAFAVRPGERVAIVGATGAGKSTILSLLLRFYDVHAGRITLGGVDIRELELSRLRATYGLVLQDVHLLAGTIASNIRLGNPDISDDAIRRAVAAVGADRFIGQLPRGIDTTVVERGATLSLGQRQLLSLARALAFDRPILLLDEATSSMDAQTEELVRDALQTVMRGRTTIAIAHRLSAIQDFDRILVLHRGELRESGTHDELLRRGGIYRRLYDSQFATARAGRGPIATTPTRLDSAAAGSCIAV
jgi:ATP-binding cassette, subfamily B, multidrug efflux pump